MTTTDVLLIGATDKLEMLNINLFLVMTTTHVPKTVVILNKDVSINQPFSTVMTTTNVLLMDVALNWKHVSTNQFLVTITIHVPRIVVILPLDAEMNLFLHKIWMITMHVPRIGVATTEELFTMKSLVTTKINASNPNVTQLKDAYTLELIVTITTNVPLTNVLKEFVSTLLLSSLLLMHVPSPLVTLLLEMQLTPRRIVMTRTHVLQTIVISKQENV
jgi:hypothetical protein